MIKLWTYFGIIGYASIIAWLVVLIMLVRNWRRDDRTRLYYRAFGIAILAVLLASWNQSNVKAIGVDQSKEIDSQRKRGERVDAAATAAEEAEAAGDESGAAETGRVDVAVATNTPPAATNDVPAYKRDGKVEREDGKISRDAMLDDAAQVDKEKRSLERTMTELERFRANNCNKYNMVFTWAAFWLSLVGLVVDYFSRFNTTFRAYYPLPVSGRLVDYFCPKAHHVRVRRASPDALRDYIERAVRKGETFIYFGERSPWASGEAEAGADPAFAGGMARLTPDREQIRLPRLWVPDPRPWLLDTTIAGMRKIEFDRIQGLTSLRERLVSRDYHGIYLPLLQFPRHSDAISVNFAIESTWFGRHGVVVEGADLARRWITELHAFLQTRVQVLASVRRTVNVIWHLDAQIPDHDLRELLFYCDETNFRLVLIGPHDPSPYVADRFDEAVDKPVTPLV